jgi:AbrB family looped-hinge helix DNA binding protein
MDINYDENMAPKFYGVTTVGERGQVVIPAEARRDLNFTPATKLLVFGTHKGGGIMITKAETFAGFLNRIMGTMSRFEEMLKEEIESPRENDL